MKTLVIDDDYSCSSMFKMFFNKYGQCDTYSLGQNGLTAYKEALGMGQPYDLVVIDIILPDMNGIDLLGFIRAEEDMNSVSVSSRTKVILTTSLDDEENRKVETTLTLGLETYYAKTFANGGLREKLEELGFYLN
ncbi:MAG: response regulator transcription factor [Candidatus Gastranaerophilales bacterium]|nr:response regulator transcription factor [Candidatus Gastranaerophilales bacterium]